MEDLIRVIRENSGGALDDVSPAILIAMLIVTTLIVIAGIVATVVSIMLWINYMKYNKCENSFGETGEEIAHRVLDDHGLNSIKVTCTGSFIMGNSYSHYFHCVRLRRLTWKKTSVTAMAMAMQKSSLAVLDKNNDPDMKKRIRLTPLIYLGPIAAIPMIIIGTLLDMYVLKTDGMIAIIMALVGIGFYALSFVMSLMVLKTEIKAQNYAIDYMKNGGLVPNDEIEMCRSLFRLYNIEYVNDMIIAMLELLLRILEIVAKSKMGKSSD